MPRGGRREGAGRKKKDRTPEGIFGDAESYLTAVVMGLTPADPARIAAARTLISYQQAKQRVPIKSLTPGQLHKKAISSVERAKTSEFEEKAAIIRAKIKAKGGTK